MKENIPDPKKTNQNKIPIFSTPEQLDPPPHPIPQQKDNIQHSIPPEPSPMPPIPSEPGKKGIFFGLLLFSFTGLVFLGFLIYKKGNVKLPFLKPTATPTPILESTPTQIPDPAADWITYTNKVMGISFKYPKDSLVEDPFERLKEVTISDPNVPLPMGASNCERCYYIQIYEDTKSNDLSLKDYVDEKFQIQDGYINLTYPEGAKIKIDEYREIEFNNNPAYRVTGGKENEGFPNDILQELDPADLAFDVVIILKSSANTIIIENERPTSIYKQKEIIFDQVLATLNLTDTNYGSVLIDCSYVQQDQEWSYVRSYLQGNYCSFDSKNECETKDVVSLDNNHLSQDWSQDEIIDCIWLEENSEPTKCVPKYSCINN